MNFIRNAYTTCCNFFFTQEERNIACARTHKNTNSPCAQVGTINQKTSDMCPIYRMSHTYPKVLRSQ